MLRRNRRTLFDCPSQDFAVCVKVLPLSSSAGAAIGDIRCAAFVREFRKVRSVQFMKGLFKSRKLGISSDLRRGR